MSSSSIGSIFASQLPFAKWGPVTLRPSISYHLLYSSGFLVNIPGESTTTTEQTVSLGLLFEIGKHWSLNYNYSHSFYSTRLIADFTGHNLSLSGSFSRGEWIFGVFQSYSKRSVNLAETGQQTPEVSYSTGASVSRPLGTRTLWDFSVSRNKRHSDLPDDTPGNPIRDATSWSGSTTLFYRFSPKFDVGTGMQFGYDSLSESHDMTTSQPNLTVHWRPTNKVSFAGELGWERRRFRDSGSGDLNSPVYNASMSYQPLAYTSFSASYNKRVAPSYFANQVSRSIGWGLSMQQRLLARYFISTGYSHGRTSYLEAVQGFLVDRKDRFNAYTVSISTTVLRRGSVSIIYQKSRNSSNKENYKVSSYQIGTELSYHF